jgi:alkylation response protein AidB-like acyl-CoA dehydrogenase
MVYRLSHWLKATTPKSLAYMKNETPYHHPNLGEFPNYLKRFQSGLRETLSQHPEIETRNHLQGLSAELIGKIHESTPLSVFIPQELGGWGGRPKESLSLVEAAAYESLSVGLMFGINSALFLDPVKKYADPSVRDGILRKFIDEKAMGGLMITEPDFGTDALSMQSAYQTVEGGYAVQGTKHWGGLTGLANFWLVAARKERENGKLARDLDLFICDMKDAEQRIEVIEYYQKLGLFQIPYGRNKVDIKVPEMHRLIPQTSGIKMVLDSLHRSRLRLSGIGLGFIKRILDEATTHCRERMVGGRALLGYDQVQYRLSEIQTFFTLTSGLCLYASENTPLQKDLSGEGIQANAMKAILTDMMQEAAQSFMQLVGSNGFRRDHIAGRAIIDCRPFQIFEGSNDVMYAQVSDMVTKQMSKVGQMNLLAFMQTYEGAKQAAVELKNLINISIQDNLSQRKGVMLGKLISSILALNHTLVMANRGFSGELIDQAVQMTRGRIASLLAGFNSAGCSDLHTGDSIFSDWKNCTS